MDLVDGPAIARMVGVTKQSVYKWRRRYADWPLPVVRTSQTTLYRRDDIEAFILRHPELGEPRHGGPRAHT